MKKNEMVEIAEFIKRIVVGREDPKKVKADVSAFRKEFQDVYYLLRKHKESLRNHQTTMIGSSPKPDHLPPVGPSTKNLACGTPSSSWKF
jgi:hypothetical protein